MLSIETLRHHLVRCRPIPPERNFTLPGTAGASGTRDAIGFPLGAAIVGSVILGFLVTQGEGWALVPFSIALVASAALVFVFTEYKSWFVFDGQRERGPVA